MSKVVFENLINGLQLRSHLDSRLHQALLEISRDVYGNPRIDYGIADCREEHVDGTSVTFNKSFKFPPVIMLSVNSQSLGIATHFFLTTTNVTKFVIYVFNDTGARISSKVSWVAIGN